MKKIIAIAAINLIAIGSSFGFEPIYDKDTRYLKNVADWVEKDKTCAEDDKVFTDYETLHLRVSRDSELNKIEDWEVYLSRIWSYAEKVGCSELSYDTVRQLLLNPTELNF